MVCDTQSDHRAERDGGDQSSAGLALNLMLLDRYAQQIEEFDNARRVYMPGGRVPGKGEIFRNPDLARTYERIARGGRDAFYSGEIAEVIDAYMRRISGYLRKEDLAAHESIWVEPLSTSYRGYDGYQAIMWDPVNRVYHGASEMRKDGLAIGY